MWKSFSQKQVHTGSLQNLFEKLQEYLKRTPTWHDVLLESFQKLSECLFFLKHLWTGASENSNILLVRTPMDTSELMRREMIVEK